jgi:plastocyanin
MADNNLPPSQGASSVNPPFVGAGLNAPFPDNYYGADHGGSTLVLSYPFLGPFGVTDHSKGKITYTSAPFTPRSSEGVYGMDVWLEQQDTSGNWSVASLNGGISDQQYIYQPINVPNPGPSGSYTFTWTFYSTPLPPNTNFRIFVYVYLYNQGGGSQGNFYVASSIGPVNTGAANDAPRIAWSASSGSINPAQVQIGQSYVVSADGQDDNGNLAAVSINRNGAPFAYAGGGNGWSGNSQNPSNDPAGTVTYTAWATDAYGAQSPTITWTVNTAGKSDQPPVSSSNASFPFFSQTFTPNYLGGSGTGGWQFCMAGFTNWTVGMDGNTGTELFPSNTWSSSWSPPSPGNYQFWVARDGDSTTNPSGAAGLYNLTVTPATPVGYFDNATPNAVTQGQTVSVGGWAADAQLGAPMSSVVILVDGGANGSFPVDLRGYRPDVQAANITWGRWSPYDVSSSGWSAVYGTSGLSVGNHSLTAVAYDSVYGVSTVLGSQTVSVSAPVPQTVGIVPAAPSVYAGQSVTFSASGGQNGYIWGGAQVGAGSSQTVTFPNVGTFTETAYSPAGGSYTQSNLANASVTVNPNGQSVSISPLSSSVNVGDSVQFTASGGQNGYVWGGAVSGSGASQTVAFGNAGNYTVTVYSPTGGNFTQSNVASASVTVNPEGQTVSLSPFNPSVIVGGSILFTASGGQNGYAWGGAASGSGSNQFVSFPNVGAYEVNVYSPAGGNYTQSNTANSTVTVTPGSQTVALTPSNPVIYVGQSVSFTASGGMNGYTWGGVASGSGQSQTVSFGASGDFTVSVYSPAGGNFAQSNTASATVAVEPSPTSGSVSVRPHGSEVKVENSENKHNSQIVIPGP